MAKVKICGITNQDDALAAVRLGADALGFCFYEGANQMNPEAVRGIVNSLPPLVTTVGVFKQQPLSYVRMVKGYCGLDMVQLQEQEAEDAADHLGRRVIKTLPLLPRNASGKTKHDNCTVLLDLPVSQSAGCFDEGRGWSLVRELAQNAQLILGGGLGPDNVGQAVRRFEPYGVDAGNSLDCIPGKKDHNKMEAFIERAIQAV